MTRHGETLWAGFAARLAAAFLLLLLAFSHQSWEPIGSGADLSIELPDGSIAALCLDGHRDGSDQHDGQRHCDACRLSSSVDLACPADFAGRDIQYVRSEPLPWIQQTGVAARLAGSTSQRGPPAA